MDARWGHDANQTDSSYDLRHEKRPLLSSLPVARCALRCATSPDHPLGVGLLAGERDKDPGDLTESALSHEHSCRRTGWHLPAHGSTAHRSASLLASTMTSGHGRMEPRLRVRAFAETHIESIDLRCALRTLMQKRAQRGARKVAAGRAGRSRQGPLPRREHRISD